jgi:hypothetical protein
MTQALIEMTTLDRAAFLSGETILNLGEGWTVQTLPALNTFKWQYSPALAAADLQRSARAPSTGGRRPIPDDVKIFVWRRDEGRCVNCGSNQDLEYDHIIPVVMGGSDTARNLQLLCEPCNRAKGGSLEQER